MTRDETIATLVLHGWQPFILGMPGVVDLGFGIVNTERKRTIVIRPNGHVSFAPITDPGMLETSEWDEIPEQTIFRFGICYQSEEMPIPGNVLP